MENSKKKRMFAVSHLITVCRKSSHCSIVSVRPHVQVTQDVLFAFLVKVMRFNGEQAAPDVSQEEHSHTYSVTSLPTETGFR